MFLKSNLEYVLENNLSSNIAHELFKKQSSWNSQAFSLTNIHSYSLYFFWKVDLNFLYFKFNRFAISIYLHTYNHYLHYINSNFANFGYRKKWCYNVTTQNLIMPQKSTWPGKKMFIQNFHLTPNPKVKSKVEGWKLD